MDVMPKFINYCYKFFDEEHIKKLVYSEFIDSIASLLKLSVEQITYHHQKELYVENVRCIIKVVNVLFSNNNIIDMFINNCSNTYPTILMKMVEFGNDDTNETKIYCQNIINKVYNKLKESNSNNPYIEVMKFIKEMNITSPHKSFISLNKACDFRDNCRFRNRSNTEKFLSPTPKSEDQTEVEIKIKEIQLKKTSISLNNFELLRLLGRGGCGTVFLARTKVFFFNLFRIYLVMNHILH